MLVLRPIRKCTKSEVLVHFGLSMSAQVKPGNEASEAYHGHTCPHGKATSVNRHVMAYFTGWVYNPGTRGVKVTFG